MIATSPVAPRTFEAPRNFREVAGKLRIPAPSAVKLPTALAETVEEHNKSCDKLESAQREVDAATTISDDDSLALSLVELQSRQEKCHCVQLDAARQAVFLWEDRAEVCEKLVEFFAAEAVKASDKLEKARTEAGKALMKAGCGPKDDPKYHADPDSAERRFQFQINTSGLVRDVLAAAHDIGNQKDTYNRMAKLALEEAAAARKSLRTFCVSRITH